MKEVRKVLLTHRDIEIMEAYFIVNEGCLTVSVSHLSRRKSAKWLC